MRLVLALLFVLTTVTAAAAEPLPRAILRGDPHVDRLENGLTVVTIEGPRNGVVAYYALVRVGSRDETEPGRTGYAHLFEHMMFRGTEARPGGEYDRAMQALGADYNAYTSTDYTLYTIVVPSVRLPTLAAMEAERFRHPAFTDQAFAVEAGSVLGELVASAADPLERMYETLVGLAFETHPYGHTVIGRLADICAMGTHPEDARSFFRRFYTPDGVVLVVSGDVRRAELLPLVREHYGTWQGTRANPAVPVEAEQTAARRRDLVHAGAAAPELLVGYRIPAFLGAPGTPRAEALRTAAALEVLRVLAFSEASPLYRAVVLEAQTVVALDAWANASSRDPGLFVVHAAVADDVHTEPALAAITEELTAVAGGERDGLVERTKRHVRYALALSLRGVDDDAELVASMIAVGDAPSTYAEYIDALTRVSSEDVRRMASLYLTEARRTVVTLRGDESLDAASERPVCGGTTP